MTRLMTGTALATLLALPALAQEEGEMSMDEVPQEVMSAAEEANSIGCEFESAAMDEGTYELAGTMQGGMGCEIDVLEDGTIDEVEEEIAMEDVPEAVSSTLESEMSGFEPSYIERSHRENGESVFYEFEGTHDGGEVDVEIAEDGSGFEMQDDSAG